MTEVSEQKRNRITGLPCNEHFSLTPRSPPQEGLDVVVFLWLNLQTLEVIADLVCQFHKLDEEESTLKSDKEVGMEYRIVWYVVTS